MKYFIYARKSTESEDRQMASLEDQIAEMKRLALEYGYDIVDVISEARSAKAPGRTGFNTMLARLQKGEADGILCWKLNRLARNPIDGGSISWLLQQGKIEHIKTFEREYKPSDNVLMMQVEFGMANQYVKDLSIDVKRGTRKKAERGWYPAPVLPLGYQHNINTNSGADNEIITDPQRFTIVKKLWKLMETGKYSVMDMKRKGDALGLTYPNGRNPSHQSYFRLFAHEFYCGYFTWPNEAGEKARWKGKHTAMVSPATFQKVQLLLNDKGNDTRVNTYAFPYKGLISCGECGGHVTAEHKLQVICTKCKNKFSVKTRTRCPVCHLDVAKMHKPSVIDKTYYHCTKNIGPCAQKSVHKEDIEKAIAEELETIAVSKEFVTWVFVELEKMNDTDNEDAKNVKKLTTQKKQLEHKIRGLIELRAEGEISSGELRTIKAKTEDTLSSIESELVLMRDSLLNWKAIAKQEFRFAYQAPKQFQNGSDERKNELALDLASNLTLKDKTLYISTHETLHSVKECHLAYLAYNGCFEPKKALVNTGNLTQNGIPIHTLRGALEAIRTSIIGKYRQRRCEQRTSSSRKDKDHKSERVKRRTKFAITKTNKKPRGHNTTGD